MAKYRGSADERVLCRISELAEQLHAEITWLHPLGGCLPIPELQVRSAGQFRPVQTGIADNLYTKNGHRSQLWIDAWMCEHISRDEIIRIFTLLGYYRGVLIAAEHLDKPVAQRMHDFDTEVWRFQLWLASSYGLLGV